MSSASNKTVKSDETRILDRLKQALRSDGDFPVRAKVVSELRALANNPNTAVEQITDLILREPSLGTRVLHLVNSAFYQRTVPITTVSQAVMQLGMKQLSDLCAGLVLMTKFVPAAKRGGIFADGVRKTILTSLLSNRLALHLKEDGLAEKGYLAGTFYNLGHLLLAYYFPQVYEAAGKRALSRGKEMSQSISEILGTTSAELSLAIVDALRIPGYYRDVLVIAHRAMSSRDHKLPETKLANAITAAALIAEAIIDGKDKSRLEEVLTELAANSGFSMPQLVETVDDIPKLFKEHCNMIELGFLTLPEYLDTFKECAFQKPSAADTAAESSSGFTNFIDEMKFAIQDEEPLASVITMAMEALAFWLHWDRVVLLYADGEHVQLLGRLSTGKPLPKEVREIRRSLSAGESVEARAFVEGTPQLFGDSLFEDGFPFAAIPVGTGDRKKGVIYCDRICKPPDDGRPLDHTEQAALTVIADLLDQSVAAWE